jgi:hypothetical protein
MTKLQPKMTMNMPSRCLVVLFTLFIFQTEVHAQPICGVPALSDAEVKDAIDTARSTGTGLPSTFPEYRWSVKKRNCYYVYTEYRIPETVDSNNTITLNQHGAIVDMRARGRSSGMACPGRVFSDNELAQIIRTEREKRGDLPSLFEDFRPQVERLRCLYLYFEHKVPEQRGDYQVFTIDSFGELMEFSRSQPY